MNRETLNRCNFILVDIDNIECILKKDSFKNNIEDLMEVILDNDDIHDAVVKLVNDILHNKLIKLQKEFDEL